MAKQREIPSLDRYYLWTQRCRILFERAATKKRDDPRRWLKGDCGLFLTRWLAALAVVVEGYRRLRCQDRAVRKLLSLANRKRLRAFRNTVCHCAADDLDARLLEFLASPEAMSWARALTDALGDHFRAARSPTSPVTSRRPDQPTARLC